MLNKNGFTIIEVITATSILTIGVLGAFSAIQMIIASTSIISSQLAATYLAQEGIENVRAIRDSNWLENRYISTAWDDGIPDGVCGAACGGTGIGKFGRQITITKIPPSEMVISVEVNWPEGSGTGEVTAATELYDWR